LLFPDRDQDVHRDRNPDLGFDGILVGSVESLDAKMLLDPLEEQLHMPARLVELSDRHSGEQEIVGEEGQAFLLSGVEIPHPAQFVRVELGSQWPGQQDGLVATQARAFVDQMLIESAELKILLGSNHEESQTLHQAVKPSEIEIAAIHDVERTRFGNQNIEDADIVHFAVGNVNERGNVAAHIQQRVEFDGAFVAAEVSPRKQRQAQVDGGGIERVDRLVQFQSELVLTIQFPCPGDQHMSEVGKDSPVAGFVGVGQGAARHRSANAHVVELARDGSQTGFDIP